MTMMPLLPAMTTTTMPRLLVVLLLLLVAGADRARARTTNVGYDGFEELLGDFEDYGVYAEGCRPCQDYSGRCPKDPSFCLLGTVPDTCGCCDQGVCARLEGEPCWDSGIPDLPKERRNEGLCARNYLCILRDDLEPEDLPEAVCTCMERDLVCGNDNHTYETPCALMEEAKRRSGVLVSQREIRGLTYAHPGPCPSRPSIHTPPARAMQAPAGQLVVLSCEVKGFPLPDIVWEFRSADGRRVVRLPDDNRENGDVNSSEDPDSFLRSSWLQLSRLARQHVGTYHCIANNSIGEASAASFITID